jgi:MOSC domain-containing protein YiiM
MWKGNVVSIHVAVRATEPLEKVSQVRAVPGKGLEGDRYFSLQGTFSNTPGRGREVTLIEVEALDALKREYGLELAPEATRRNLLTRGVALNHLVGRDFRVGRAVLRGVRLCEPCSHLESLTQQGVIAGLVHRGGLRAEVIQDGIIRAGDVIEEVQASDPGA